MRSEKTKEEAVDLPATSRPLRATPPSEPSPVVELFQGVTGEAPYRSPPTFGRRWRTGALDTIAEASARVAARKAAHQAQLAEEA